MKKYTLEQFKSSEPYKDLELIEDPFEKQIAEQELENYARDTLHFKHFKKYLTAYRKSLKKAATFDNGGITSFDGLENELYLKTWNADESGIWRKGRDGLREYACTHPIYPCELMRNIDTGELKVKLRFKRGSYSEWVTQVVDFDTISNSRNITSLSKIGISVTSGQRAQSLVDYLAEIIDCNYDVLKKTASTSHLGWNNKGFSPFINEVQFDGNPNFERVYNAIKPHGSVEAWINEITACRKYSPTVKILTAASLAAVLIEPLHLLPFFIHLWGMDSGTGKTVAQMCAASIWGNPTVGEPFFPTFKGTQTGFEFLAGFLHNLPLFIDELQLAKDSHGKVNFNVYELASGTGKLRGTRSLGLANVPIWKNCFITSGETPLVGEQDGAGALNRVIEIECKASQKCIEDGHKTASIIKDNYGFIGKVFVHKLQEEGNMDKAKELYEKIYSECLGNQTTEKQAMAAAVIIMADMLANEFNLFIDEPLTVADMTEFLKTADTVSASERGYEYICDWVATNQNKFKVTENGECYGDIETDDNNTIVYIIRSVFNKACYDAKINPKALLSQLKTRNLLKIRGNGRGYAVRRRIGAASTPSQCIAVKINADDTLPDIDF